MDLSRQKPWERAASYDPNDNDSLIEDNNRLRRTLCALAREHIHIKKQFERAKDTLGFNKPFPFLQLPREVRDQIYAYTLLAPANIRIEKRPLHNLNLEDVPWKPMAPNICLVNKQIHQESVKVMYSSNTFRLDSPGDLLDFEEEIGTENRELIRSLEIIDKPVFDEDDTPDPVLGVSSDWPSDLVFWAKALTESRLGSLNEIGVTLRARSSGWLHAPVFLPRVFQRAVKHVLGRRKELFPAPRLIFKGFIENKLPIFPDSWEIILEENDESEFGDEDHATGSTI